MNQEIDKITQNEPDTVVSWRKELPALVVLVLPFIVLPLVWSQLPDRIPIHWNSAGDANGWVSPGIEMFYMPFLAIGIYLLLLFIHRIDPKRKGRSIGKPMPAYRFLLVTAINGIFLVTIAVASNDIDNALLMRLIGVTISLLFLVLGNYLSAIRPNYFVGIRTPWTLESADVWKTTHRTAGRIWVVTGAVLFGLSIFLPWPIFQFFLTIGIIVMIVYPVMHSFLLFKRLV